MAAKPPPLMAASFPWDRAAVATSLEFSSGGDIDGGTRGCWLVSQWVAGEEGARKKREVMTEGEEVLAAPVTTTPAPVKACLGGEGVAHSVGGRFWKEFEGEALCFRILGLTIFDLGPNSNAEQNFASSVHYSVAAMGRAPCCDKANVKRGPWSPDEDATLKNYLHTHGTGGNWIALPRKAGLRRCGKSCRLRWLNYLRPDIKHGGFTEQEDQIICTLYTQMGSRQVYL
ncbi:hypothetical protein Ahy_A06g030776 [Arachis hypogaea]|uniref:Uncharacterized protein n=1 Tax=Arachis hypogaea TaxID=3818 RepID=A0A445CXD8_ARAHY|nr:hypothetical protein Ahy_A06g030776 [Arachis hypogaea]